MVATHTNYRYETPLTVDTNAYTANDVVGGLITVPVPSGFIRSVKLVDADGEEAAFTLYLFDSEPTDIADDAAFATVLADETALVRILTLAADEYTALSESSVGWFKFDDKTEMGIDYFSNGALYAYLVCDGTPTFTAADDLTLVWYFWINNPGQF